LPIPTGFRHTPEKLGYLLSSKARAALIVSVVASARMLGEPRKPMRALPEIEFRFQLRLIDVFFPQVQIAWALISDVRLPL
jgi:hypothetical protein